MFLEVMNTIFLIKCQIYQEDINIKSRFATFGENQDSGTGKCWYLLPPTTKKKITTKIQNNCMSKPP